MLGQAILILGLIVNTTIIDKINDPMIHDGKVVAPVIVRVTGTIDESSADRFAQQMLGAQETGQTVIPVVISSYGGSVYALLKMVDIINKVKETTPVATIVIGKAMSAGAALFTCGSEGLRYIAPNATLMIHEVSSTEGGKTGEILAGASETDRLNKLMLTIMSKNINKNETYLYDVIHSKGHADWFITPTQAIEHNIANKIGVPNLKIKANVILDLE